MKYYIGILLVLLTITAKGQTKKEIKKTLKSIETQEEFQKYKDKNSDYIDVLKQDTDIANEKDIILFLDKLTKN